MKIHKSITSQRVLVAVQANDYIGFCIKCGKEMYGCEPDMTHGECENCECRAVYGAEELLIMIG